MNKVSRSMLFLCCLLLLVVIGGCYNAGYKSAKPNAAASRLGELSDEFTNDIVKAIPQEAPAVQEPASVVKTTSGADDDLLRTDTSDKSAAADEISETSAADVSPQEADREAGKETGNKAGKESGDATPKLTVTEGDLVKVSVAGSDPDGDAVTYTYSSPLNQDGQWQTRRGDASTYEVYVTATDEFGKSAAKSVVIEVLKANNLPVINVSDEVEVFEGELVTLDLAVFDGDTEDTIKSTISGWMNTTSKMTTFDDAGSYTVTVTATDGKDTVSKEVAITVKNVNRAPEFEIVIG